MVTLRLQKVVIFSDMCKCLMQKKRKMYKKSRSYFLVGSRKSSNFAENFENDAKIKCNPLRSYGVRDAVLRTKNK